MKYYSLITVIFRAIIIFCTLTFYTSCNEEDTTIDCVPVSHVQASYNLNLPIFANLQNPQAYVVLDADGTNGSKGVIILNTGNGFKAYDRNAPHICPDVNTALIVEDDIKLMCPKDGAQWILQSGQPLNDQTSGRSPRQFYVQVNGNTLEVTN